MWMFLNKLKYVLNFNIFVLFSIKYWNSIYFSMHQHEWHTDIGTYDIAADWKTCSKNLTWVSLYRTKDRRLLMHSLNDSEAIYELSMRHVI